MQQHWRIFERQFSFEEAATVAAVLLIAQVFFWQTYVEYRVRSILPKRVSWRTRILLSLWGMVSPWMDNIHALRLLFAKKSFLRMTNRGRRSLRVLSFEQLRDPRRNPKMHIVLIHGTWAMEDYATRWKPLIASLASKYPDAAIWGIHWLAFNTSGTRFATASLAVRALRSQICRPADVPVHLIGFSHGGSLLTEIMRHASARNHWLATVVGMPLLTPDSMQSVRPERTSGGNLLWHPRDDGIGITQLLPSWVVIPAFFALAYFYSPELPTSFSVLCFILAGLLAYNRYFNMVLTQQALHNSKKLWRGRRRNEQRLR